MALPVVTVASGGLPVVDATASGLGLPVSEMPAKFGLAVTKVASSGKPVVYAPANSDGSSPVNPLFTTWNPADKSAVLTLSPDNLTVTVPGSASGCRAINGFSSGKYYWEFKYSTLVGTNYACGLATATALLGNVYNSPSSGTVCASPTGTIFNNGTSAGSNIGTAVTGTVIGIAVDLSAALIWFRQAPSGNWNGSGTNNPATGIGGVNISAIGVPLYPWCGTYTSTTGGTIAVADFGASAFVGAVPSGFTAGWPATSGSPSLDFSDSLNSQYTSVVAF